MKAAQLWGIAEPLVLIGFIGTIAKETGTFYPLREAWWVYDRDPAAARRYYEDTSQHAAYGGGWWYHGRGWAQTTHIGNYQIVQDKLASIGINVDLVGNPELLLTPEYAAHALAIYFLTHAYPPGGMIQACRDRNWREVRKAVNGVYEADGIAKLQYADSVLLPLAQQRGFA